MKAVSPVYASKDHLLTGVVDKLTQRETPDAVERWYGRVSWVRLGLKTLVPVGVCLASSVYLANRMVDGHFADCTAMECPPTWANVFFKTTLAATLFVPSVLACGLGAAYIDDYTESQLDRNAERIIAHKRTTLRHPPVAPNAPH